MIADQKFFSRAFRLIGWRLGAPSLTADLVLAFANLLETRQSGGSLDG